MPRYEFECPNGHVFEAQLPLAMYDEIKLGVYCVVDECKGFARKVASAPGFHLKGPGWHRSDYDAYGPKRK